MDDIQKRILGIEKEIRETPHHKGTEHHLGKLRARLAKLKDSLIDGQTRRRQGSGGSSGFALRKQGDATVVLVGPPSVGKSTLLNKLTNAKSRVAAYAFTTVTVIPGMMKYRGAHLQVLDIPGLIEGASRGRGRGREVLSVVRGADLLLLMAEVGQEDEFGRMRSELHLNGVRLNESPPKVAIQKTLRGGLNIYSTVKQDFNKETVKEIAREFGLTNAEIKIREKLSLEQLIDAFAKNRVWVPAIYVLNKIDLGKASIGEWIAISAEKDKGIDELRQMIWEKLGLVRVFLRKEGATDYEQPMVMRNSQTLLAVAQKIGEEFAQNVKEVKIWGRGARFPGQKVSLKTSVLDELEVQFL